MIIPVIPLFCLHKNHNNYYDCYKFWYFIILLVFYGKINSYDRNDLFSNTKFVTNFSCFNKNYNIRRNYFYPVMFLVMIYHVFVSRSYMIKKIYLQYLHVHLIFLCFNHFKKIITNSYCIQSAIYRFRYG